MKRRGFTLEIPELDNKNASHLPNKCEAFYFHIPGTSGGNTGRIV